MARSSRSTWERRVAALRRSGLSHREFAHKHGVNVGTLRSWVYRLRREEPEPRLLPVRVAEGARAGVEIVLPTGVLVRLASGMTAHEVAAIVKALG
ncbi:MAG: IS66 family insertion sequence element accessory protein TnpB [Planctomycetes bacterium]|nr:IS66 family insertion sequence element accessory protein TnpB [Planctomycetota bacterium]